MKIKLTRCYNCRKLVTNTVCDKCRKKINEVIPESQVEMAIRIIETIGDTWQMTSKTIAQELGVDPKPTYRVLRNMVEEEFLIKRKDIVDNRTYRYRMASLTTE